MRKNHPILTRGRQAALGATLLLAGTGIVQAEFSANIGVTSNYIFRGLTQTDDGAAVQGGLDYGHESGVYVGAWASNVDFEIEGSNFTGYELDGWIGFAGAFEQLNYDLGYIYYAYPGSRDLKDSDFGEIYLNLNVDMLTVGVFYVTNAESEVREQFKDAVYYYANLDVPITEDWSAGATLGRQDFRSSAPEDDYTHWQLGVTRHTDIGDFTFAYDQTDLSGNDGDAKVSASFVMTF
ncbi:TorF family putative porin [Methylonatrum kenyense]|uniref:TorF family putative porin n=1 Tax=Methylonatrum kenyense TaxID=455253 RepID=UPI0020C0F702|nr:TorF family putative porin [Methylonatrum kenyense]MCK8515143.1 TorF family putative porin [Methylonatrum kenyense]